MPGEAGEGAGSRAEITTGYPELEEPSWIWAQARIYPARAGRWQSQDGDSRAPRWSIPHRAHPWGWGAQEHGQLWGWSRGQGVPWAGSVSAGRGRVSPALCAAVMGALESRGVLRRMSDMLEMLMKRMDILARLENSTDFHRGDEARFPLDRSVRPRGAALGAGALQGQSTPRC